MLKVEKMFGAILEMPTLGLVAVYGLASQPDLRLASVQA